MPILVCVLLYCVLGLMALRSFHAVRAFRIETPERTAKYKGTAWQWMRAVLNASNYVPEARAALRRFWFWLALFQLGLFAILIVLAIYYP
jgi:hypothetical protein